MYEKSYHPKITRLITRRLGPKHFNSFLPLNVRRAPRLVRTSMLPCRPKISEVLQRSNGPLGRRTLAPSVITTRTDSAVAAQDEDGCVDAAVLISCQCNSSRQGGKGKGQCGKGGLHIIKQNAVDMLVCVVDVRFLSNVSQPILFNKGYSIQRRRSRENMTYCTTKSNSCIYHPPRCKCTGT